MTNLRRAALAACLSLPLQATAEPITLMDADDLNWDTTSEGVAFAPLQGDRFAGAYQAMVRLPAGIVSPPHVKTANMYGVLLQGEMIHHLPGDDPGTARRITEGALYAITKDAVHVSACVSDVDCLVYLYQDGAFDFLPVAQ